MFLKDKQNKAHENNRIIQRTCLVYGLLLAAWILAWILKENLDTSMTWIASSQGSFSYWTNAKILIWILPALWLIRLSGRGVPEVLNISNWKSWLFWGGGIGFLIAITGFVPTYLQGKPFLPDEFSFACLNVLLIAPVFEEFLIRGAILGNFKRGYSFFTANILSSLMFVGIHLPGWYFMDSLLENLAKPFGGALSIFILGLLFGWAAHKSKSVIGGMLAHFLNNLF
jgi:CAAX protease family protein